MTRNLLLTLAFDGTNYHGFQVQKNAVSVCETFQNALFSVIGDRCDVKGCSRTDSGVHARMYCLSFKTRVTIPCDRLVLALNRALPPDIAALSAKEVPLEFHARYDCAAKRYLYRVHNSRVKDPFSPNFSYRYGYSLDEALLNGQAQDFLGTHDFSAFQAARADVNDTVRTVKAFSVARQGDEVLFTVTADGFLYNMVRIMVGTLLFIGMGRIEAGTIPAIIASKDRQKAGKTMPAHGLYLDYVYYK